MFITSTWSCSMTCWFLSSCPTSNHNSVVNGINLLLLYIVLFLHQTTTISRSESLLSGCILYYSYIKPQLTHTECGISRSCISYYSYIKPQLVEISIGVCLVVYRTIPTSNHNLMACDTSCMPLYIVLFLHQTTTVGWSDIQKVPLYIVLFLHQTTTVWRWVLCGC